MSPQGFLPLPLPPPPPVAGGSVVDPAVEQAASAKHPTATQVATSRDFPGKVE